jgi:1,4-dihydroxy-2-naphthoyl-CoA synthase
MTQTTTTRPSLETVEYEKKSAIAYITLNRPKVLNALNKRAVTDLRAGFEDARDDSEIGLVGGICGRFGRFSELAD